jgi:hypothetical protein
VLELLNTIFGTPEQPEEGFRVALGSLAFEQSENATRAIAWNGVEVVRAVDHPIRDKDWGTSPTLTIATSQDIDESSFRLTRDFETGDASVAGHFEMNASSDGKLSFSLRLSINRDTQLCRAGFTLLHPIDGLAGEAVSFQRPNGERSETRFPDTISPAEPATNFVAMRYKVHRVSADINMEGGVFDMEDQRNWSDASYKTYIQTASFPAPYFATKGEIVEQKVTLCLSGIAVSRLSPATTPSLHFDRQANVDLFPELAFAADPNWGTAIGPPSLSSLRRVVRLDLRRPVDLASFDFVKSERPAAPFDLELVVSDQGHGLEKEMADFAAALAKLGATPDHVIALPAAYLKSYQSKGPWPSGASPMDAVRSARQTFPSAKIGGGVLTNFTELNRCRPNIEEIDYLTHGSSAIVHAADDVSVFQTLEALPDIFRSSRRIASGRAYRLGLISIGMRRNPYGEGLTPGKELARQTKRSFDPRAGALFGAAWLVGVAAATKSSGAELVTLASLGGPFAVADAHRLTPSYHVLTWLARMQGERRYNPTPGDKLLHVVAVEAGADLIAIVANGSAAHTKLACPGTGRIAILDARSVADASEDPYWPRNATTDFEGTIDLPSYAIAFLELTEHEK